ncbi:hypothetical protein EN866_35155 [Mesorhizobium sp. M2D.F.Ca.ET.223.01.1.1]|uniref:hypothetical protein n=1 Tax=Mesorhizobium sp. M2D.F.Ca.ET.223.01.1.1 TaxID=2563940 RepID=UPI0010919624|nr:hypothetical protein [Mesorhizobium sp. M2D.F.Ca.ET.223.01.1.1]TGR81832.1 hypothetical protein EN866_35155 [Mesorhizobium sp. M2D.F.Ca.ET.223.01.1.1]TGT64474.1 hypothetical protein EN802_32315 [bacterium M00.F.Ca.ET.159.01.1.1]TGT79319.1 hypothetical protein EN800_31655 [bacterium M00.F.Ca.ET.157.01.1.1]
MNRSERRKALKGADKLSANRVCSFNEIRDDDAKAFLVSICRACLPHMPRELLSDERLVEAIYELVEAGLLDVYVQYREYGCDVFTELKKPGRGVISTMGPIPAIRFTQGGVQ